MKAGKRRGRAGRIIFAEAVLLLLLCVGYMYQRHYSVGTFYTRENYIKWVDFNVSYEALQKAYEWDRDTYGQKIHLNWIELLACVAVKNGGDFSSYKNQQMDELADRLLEGKETAASLMKGNQYYDYYLEAYGAVLCGMVGEYETETDGKWEKKYGLKAFLPIAKGYEYSDYDDFGSSRSYGYKREHLGHDMLGQTGTPIVAIESGTIEALGWNQYGGWRIGIRSFDKRRYYYYAHLRQNFPYNKSLQEGSVVQAGDVIGYMGHTGYSAKENVNNIDVPHLHWGMQLIFDESQKDGNCEIWIDCYQLTRFLYQNRCETWKDTETKEYHRTHQFRDLENQKYFQSSPAR